MSLDAAADNEDSLFVSVDPGSRTNIVKLSVCI